MEHRSDSPFDTSSGHALDEGQADFEHGALIATFSHPPAPARGRRAAARMTPDGENSFAGMVGRSEAMRQVFAQIERVGPSDTTVTIVGESGTGKELAAQALHDLSPRRQAPFIAVNCGAIPANLAEAEFFGFEKGAFTGAQRQHCGHFERANGGTLFLDEIAEMPLDLQVKLLRVLETGTISRVGGSEERAYILAENEVTLECAVHTSAAAIRVGPDGCLRVPLGSTVAQAEREMILATIHHCGGSKRKAADVLGIILKTVYNKLANYDP